MITKDTHTVDWNKTAQITGVVLFVLVKGIWWLTKRAGIFLFAAFVAITKVFVAILSVWASLPENEEKDNSESIYAAEGEPGIDSNEEYGLYGESRIKNTF